MTSRPLTDGETALAKTVFGASIDYGAVRISDEKFLGLNFLPEGTAMAPNGNLYMPGCYKDDYSQEPVMWQGTFIHEMTHVWQFQNKILQPIAEAFKLTLKHDFNYTAAYAYTLDGKKDLLDYNMEQQASIVQDYFAMKQDGYYSPWGNCQNTCDDDEKKKLFEKVMEKFIADPGYAKKDTFAKPAAKPKDKGHKPPKA